MVTSQPCAGSSRASARATWDDPPRGKNIKALTTRTKRLYPNLLPGCERDDSRHRPAAREDDPVLFARGVAQPPAAHQRRRSAAIEVERDVRAERGQRRGELAQREAGLVVGAPVAGDGEHPPVGRQRQRGARVAAGGDVGVELALARREALVVA